MKAKITKVRWNKGVMDNGTEYDYTRVTIELPVSETSANEFGVDYLECEYGNEAKHTELLHLRNKLPCEIECEMNQSIKRGKLVTEISNIKPIAATTKATAS